MTLHEKTRLDIQSALKARDKEHLRALRNILAAITNELVANGRKPQEILSDEDVLTVIARLAKQRKDSIFQFKEGGRDDLVASEERELTYLQKYLPADMSDEEVKKIAIKKKEELGIADKTGMGALMGAVMKEVKGQADGNKVKEIVEKLLNG